MYASIKLLPRYLNAEKKRKTNIGKKERENKNCRMNDSVLCKVHKSNEEILCASYAMQTILTGSKLSDIDGLCAENRNRDSE